MHKLYLDPFMDMCNGEIISFGIDKHPSAENVMSALEKAISVTSDCQYRRTFHSDQGWAYQMKSYSRRLKEEHIFQSMSRKGNCHDNSVMENFFGFRYEYTSLYKHNNMIIYATKCSTNLPYYVTALTMLIYASYIG